MTRQITKPKNRILLNEMCIVLWQLTTAKRVPIGLYWLNEMHLLAVITEQIQYLCDFDFYLLGAK